MASAHRQLIWRNYQRLSTFHRPMLRSRSSLASQNATDVQHVRLQPSPRRGLHRYRNQIACGMTIALAWRIWEDLDIEVDSEKPKEKGSIVHAIQGQTLQTTSPDAAVAEVEEVTVPDEIPDNAWFIPMGFARQLPQAYYRGRDPEWQSFREFAHDNTKNMQIREELVVIISSQISSMPNFQKILGDPIQPRKSWLFLDFPDGPPPEYERSGLEITSDYIAWTTRPVSPYDFERLKSVLWPKPMASAFWESYKTLWSIQIANIKHMLNIGPPPKNPNRSVFDGFVMPKLGKREDTDRSRYTAAASEPPKVEADQSKDENASPDDPTEDDDIATALSADSKASEGETALATFGRTLAQEWKPPVHPPERGSFFVLGLVEIGGTRARAVLDIVATYHPQESRWGSVSVGVRKIQPHKQGPKGGS